MIKEVIMNDTYIPYMNAEQPLQIFYGGSSSGKSFFLAQRVILDNLSGTNWLVCRNISKTLRKSTFNELIKAIYALDAGNYYTINQTDMTITCKLNRKQILFTGLMDAERLKSVTPISGVLERVWIEEATEVSYNSYKQLKKRLRGPSDKKKFIQMSFNPILREHWIHKEFFDEWRDDENVYSDKDKLIVKTTYLDNRFLTEEDIYSLENEGDEYFRRVYTYGEWGVLGNVIYRNWRVEDLSAVKNSFDNIYNGLDFGYTNPNAFISCHVDLENKKLYVIDEIYQRGQGFESLAHDVLEKIGKNQYVICDCENPQAIAELCNHHVNALPAVKGAGSVLYGIKWLQKFEIIIDVNCQNFRNEISAYHWQEDKGGNAIEKPVKQMDHLLDALRYATEPLHNAVPSAASRW